MVDSFGRSAWNFDSFSATLHYETPIPWTVWMGCGTLFRHWNDDNSFIPFKPAGIDGIFPTLLQNGSHAFESNFTEMDTHGWEKLSNRAKCLQKYNLGLPWAYALAWVRSIAQPPPKVGDVGRTKTLTLAFLMLTIRLSRPPSEAKTITGSRMHNYCTLRKWYLTNSDLLRSTTRFWRVKWI